ncbi:hypothetical protein FB107DRAFT_277977 [Schizophyllum commune]
MAASTPSTPALPDVRTSLGPILISSVLAWILWGMLTMQVIRYYLSYQRDSSVMKGMVASVWYIRVNVATGAVFIGYRFLDLAHAIVLFRGIYQCLVNDFGRVVPLDNDRVMGEMPPRVLITILVQGFCFWRIWKLYRSYVPVALYVLTTLLQVAFTVIYMLGSFGNVSVARRRLFLDLAGFGYLAAVFVADLTMAGMLTTLLYKQHLKTPLKNTSEMLRRLIYFSINTGTWTAVFALIAIILSIRPIGDAYYWTMFDVAVCGIYSNTLLVNLNGRDYIVGEDAITLSFLKSSRDGSSLTAGDSCQTKSFRTQGTSGLRSHSLKASARKRAPSNSLAEEASVFEAAKRSQIADV